MQQKNNQKICLITGSSKGIGLAIAEKFDSYGVKVLLNSRHKIKKKLIKNFIKKPEHFKFDVTSTKSLENGLKKIKKKYKKIDYLICNVGFSRSLKKNQFKIDEWKKIFDKNFFSTLETIFLFKKYFNNNSSKKKIICISSISGMYVSAAPTTYAIAKSALNNFVKHASKSLTKENIILNCVAPGNVYFKGGVWDKNLKKNKKYYRKYISSEVPENRLADPREIAELVTYLCSDKSTFINGSVLSIDGGQDKSL